MGKISTEKRGGMNIDNTKVEAVGRWPGVMEQLGIEVGNGKHGPCPICGGIDRFRFDNMNGEGTWICNQCGAGDGFALVQKVKGVDFVGACKLVAEVIGIVEPKESKAEPVMTAEKFREIFKLSQKLSLMDGVTLYLRQRGLKIDVLPENIRTTSECWESETKTKCQAMLAIFHNHAGKAITMHRTYLDGKGGKLNIKSPKKILPPLENMNGGACRLYKVVNGTIGIAEGIETAIAIYEATGTPTWAALSAQLLTSFEPPPGIHTVIVYGDSDINYTGQKAAYSLANKLVIHNKLTVDVAIPDIPGTDFLDEITVLGG